jgi:hypothetical protein
MVHMRAKLLTFGKEPNSAGSNIMARARPLIKHTSMQWWAIGVSSLANRMDDAEGPKSVTATSSVWRTMIRMHAAWPFQLYDRSQPKTDNVTGKAYSNCCCVDSSSAGHQLISAHSLHTAPAARWGESDSSFALSRRRARSNASSERRTRSVTVSVGASLTRCGL